MAFLTLDDDDRVIVDTAAAFAAKRLEPHAMEWDKSKHFPVDVMREAAELGMAAIYCGEDVGGSGLRRIDAVRIFEQLSYADPVIASFISIHNMCAWMIDTYGNAEQRKSWIPRLASMDAIASYCLTEPGAGSDAPHCAPRRFAMATTLCSMASSSSSPEPAPPTCTSSWPAPVPKPAGISAFIVEKGTPGLSFGANEGKWAGTPNLPLRSSWRASAFRPTPCSVAPRGEGKGFGIAMSGLNGGRLNIAACSLGGGQAAYDKTVRYVADRRAFGAR